MSDALPLSRGFSLGHLLVHQVRRRLRPAGWLVQRRRKHPDERSISISTRSAPEGWRVGVLVKRLREIPEYCQRLILGRCGRPDFPFPHHTQSST